MSGSDLEYKRKTGEKWSNFEMMDRGSGESPAQNIFFCSDEETMYAFWLVRYQAQIFPGTC